MIRIIQGNPGSGKSYYAVNYLSKFGKYEQLYDDFIVDAGVLIITNIEGFRVKHLDLHELIDRFTVEKFFTVDNFEKIIEKYKARHVIVIIDEAQKIFDSKYYDKDVFYFFQYHRHLGIDIFLCTQSVSTISRQLIPLCEFIVNAVPRSKGMAGLFRYKFTDCKGTFMYSQAVRKKKEIFKIYQSFKSDEAEKPKNVITHYLIMLVAVFVVVGIGFKMFVSTYIQRGNHVPKKQVIQPAPVPAAVPVAPAPVSGTVSTAILPSPRPVAVSSSPPAHVKSLPLHVSSLPRKVRRHYINELKADTGIYPIESFAQVNSHEFVKVGGIWLEDGEFTDLDQDANTVKVIKPDFHPRRSATSGSAGGREGSPGGGTRLPAATGEASFASESS